MIPKIIILVLVLNIGFTAYTFMSVRAQNQLFAKAETAILEIARVFVSAGIVEQSEGGFTIKQVVTQ